MAVSPLVLAVGGFTLVLGSWVAYMATVPSGRVPLRPFGHLAVQSVGGVLGVVGIGSAVVGGGPLLGPVLPGAMAAVMAGLFVFLYSQRSTPVGQLRISVGAPLRAFTAGTPDGDTFDSASLKGRRVLLKFFRGHW